MAKAGLQHYQLLDKAYQLRIKQGIATTAAAHTESCMFLR